MPDPDYKPPPGEAANKRTAFAIGGKADGGLR